MCLQVAVSLYNGMDSIISILIICLLIVIAALVAVFAVLEVRKISLFSFPENCAQKIQKWR